MMERKKEKKRKEGCIMGETKIKNKSNLRKKENKGYTFHDKRK